jgi:hypothetical protein
MACPGFLRVQDAAGRALASAQVGHAGKGGVALKISGGRQQPQWPAPGLPFLFGIGLPVRDWRQTLRRERGDGSAPSSQDPAEISDCDILDSAAAVL